MPIFLIDVTPTAFHSGNVTLKPDTPVQFAKGVGPHLAQVLSRKGILTAWDLLHSLPIKYIDRRQIHSIRSLPVEKRQTFIATIAAYGIKSIARGRRRILEVLVSDDSGHAKITFFRFNENWLKKKFPVGARVLFFGDVRRYGALKQMAHPEMEIWDDEEGQEASILPFYSLTEGLNQHTMRRILRQNLEDLLALVVDEPLSVRAEGTVKIGLTDAYRHLHAPPLSSDILALNEHRTPEHQRVIYDEFFYLQLGIVSKRYRNMQQPAHRMNPKGELFARGVSALPFELTPGQRQAIDEIRQDMASGKPMNRLIQGDVGSGKTLVAFLSSLFAIEAGAQAALMVPTEILAEQHFKNLLRFENILGLRIELVTSSTPGARREEILARLKHGQVDLLIGTHALITPDVMFYNLAYVIIDEQHRFGVVQRAQLKGKGRASAGGEAVPPHMLFMTATPIPRTLSMCLYGDMDVSIMREMPKGRLPIRTHVFHERARSRAYSLILRELKSGRQVYFVYPLVEESEKLEHLKDATLMHQQLQKEFDGFEVALVHGRMRAAEKDAVMTRFKAGQAHILVSTTVIEVGVDVPNATVMVIEHAERFGLSQLHQLRGRVGRGEHQSVCILMAGYAQSEESRFRLKVMEESSDGFVIAEEDLKLRGPGDFLGTKQAGMPDFRLAELVRDGHLLAVAKKRAEEILAVDADLHDVRHARLKDIMLERWGQRLDLTLV